MSLSTCLYLYTKYTNVHIYIIIYIHEFVIIYINTHINIGLKPDSPKACNVWSWLPRELNRQLGDKKSKQSLQCALEILCGANGRELVVLII